MKTTYDEYTSDKQVTVTKRELFTNGDGFPNENAFRDFAGQLKESDEYYLACIIVDLTESNKKGFAFGTLMLRKAFLRLKDKFFVFHIHGNKFNVVVSKADIELADKMLASESEDNTKTYYGFVKDTPITGKNFEEIRKRGVKLMYQNMALRTNKEAMDVRDDKIVGDKGNTPPELQETVTHKFRDTMWYGEIQFEEIEPNVRNITAYVFPTEYRSSLAAVNMVVIVDDLLNKRVFTGTKVAFGFDGIRFTVTSRFDDEGHLEIVYFKSKDSKGTCRASLTSHEGVCIPASFGKRIGNGREIYPFKPNPFGTYNYVLWDKENQTATLDETGMVEMNGKLYAVHFHPTGIDLVEQ